VTTTWNNYLTFDAPAAAPVFSFAAARFKKAAKILAIATATTTEFTPGNIIDVNKALTGASPTIVAATATEFVGVDAFVGSAEVFGTPRGAIQGLAQVGQTSGTFSCASAASTEANCGAGAGNGTYKANLATTNLDYTAAGQSGFNMIGAGASYKAGAMWTYLWGWVATTTTTSQTGGNDLTFESNMKYIDWAVKRDIQIKDNVGAVAGGSAACTSATDGTGCKAGSGTCLRGCLALTHVAVPVRTAKDITVTRVAMSGSSLVASAAAAIVAASLAS